MKGAPAKLLFTVLAALLALPLASEAQTTSGTIPAPGETWDHTMNPILITGDITIPDGRYLRIGHGCDIRFQEDSDDTHWGWDILRSEIIVYGDLKIDGRFPESWEPAQACTGGSNTELIDTLVDFVDELVGPGAILINVTDGSEGIVTGISTDTNPNDTLEIGAGMSGGGTNDPGDSYQVVVPTSLTNSGTGEQGWFGIVFSDNTATGEIEYCNIDHSVYGINFTACAPLPNQPTVNKVTINDVSTGIYFDDESSPTIDDTTVIHATYAYSCWAFSQPVITNCNATSMLEGGIAVYATEGTSPRFEGCAFSTASVQIDQNSAVYMQDSTVSDSDTGVVGNEYKIVGAGKIPSFCTMEIDNCNVIGLGDSGKGITWDDNLDVLKVEYSRVGGFTDNVWLRWGSIDIEAGIFHQIGKRFTGTPFSSTCTGGTRSTLIDTATDFIVAGAQSGMMVVNYSKSSSGTVETITTTTNPNDTLNMLTNMSGGAWNVAGDVYGFVVTGSNTHSGTCSAGTMYEMSDYPANFIALGFGPGAVLSNITDGSTGIVSGIATRGPGGVSVNDTLLIFGGMSGGITNTNTGGDSYSVTQAADYNNADFGDMDNPDPYRNWPPWYVAPYSQGENEFYGIQDPNCLYNIDCEQSALIPPRLYQIDAWAENNWWVTTNNTVISRYIWDNGDSPNVGAVDYIPHISPDEKRTYSISGRVLDNLEEPVDGVRVSVDLSGHGYPAHHAVLADITGADGYYTIYGLLPDPGNDYTVVPEKLYYAFDPQSVDVEIDDSDVSQQDFDATLPPPRILSVSRADLEDGGEFGLPGRTNWGKNSETTAIVITGLNFRETPSVFIRGTIPSTSDAPCSHVVWVTSTTLNATVPAGKDTGNYSIRVVNPDGQEVIWGSNTVSGTCTAAGGSVLLIDDSTDFSEEQVGLYAYLTNDTDASTGTVTGMTTTTNPNDTLQISAGMSGGNTNDNGDAYTVYAAPGFTIVPPPAPKVFSINPNPIFIDQFVWLTVTGDDLITGCDLTINGHTWATLATSGTSLSAYYSAGMLSAGTWTVTVTNPDGQTSNDDVTLTVNGPPPPVPTSIVPDHGPNNRVTDVIIYGTGFDETPGVMIGTTDCINETWVSSSEMTAQVPIGITPGLYDVTVTNPDEQAGVITNGYTVDEPALNVIGISPPLGLASADTDVIIVGENIKAADPSIPTNDPTVTVGGTTCTNVRVISTTCLQATVPSTIPTGLHDVIVDNDDAQPAVTLTNGYTAVTAPTISSPIVPDNGDLNDTTAITINGSDFAYIPRVEVDGTPCTDVAFLSAAQLTANVPSGMAAGTYDVMVTNPLDQSGTLTGAYTVNAAPAGEPAVTSVSPSVSTNDLDTAITITGTGFTGATGVTVGATACADVIVVDDTQVTATAPSGIRVGDHDLTVTNAAGTGTLTHGFTMGGSGTLDGDTTLSGSVTLTGDVVVPDTITLTVEPGSILKFKANSDDTSGGWDGTRGEIRVYGRVNILGEEQERVALISDGGQDSDWLGIVLSDTTASAWIESADITYAVYGLSFESSFSGPITADYPRPWVRDIFIATCSTGVALNSSVGFTCPAIDDCSIDGATTGISSGGTAAPIFTGTLFRNVTSVGLESKENAIVTLENSSIVDAAAAVSCPESETGEETNASTVNVIFSVLGNGAVTLSDSAFMTARKVTHLLFPDETDTTGIVGAEAASLAWDYSNIVQGNPEGRGIDWPSAGDLAMSMSVVEGWGIGVRRTTQCGEVNLGDGPMTGGNEFLGIMNPLAQYNVANGDPAGSLLGCATDIPAQYNWWLTEDTSVIDNYLFDVEDDPALGDIDYSNYRSSPRTYSVSGRILDPGGSGVDRVQVVAYYSTSHTDNDRIGMTDNDGYYKIYGLVPGDYTVEAEKQGYTFDPPAPGLSVTVTDTDLNGEDFEASLPAPTVYGIRRTDGVEYPPYGDHWAFNNGFDRDLLPLDPTCSTIAVPTDVVITGINFRSGATASLVGALPSTAETSISNVQYVSSTMLTATVQTGLDVGGYGVKVYNPDTQNSTFGADVSDPAFNILDPPAPVVNMILPAEIWLPYNMDFHIEGENFWGPPTIWVGTAQGYYSILDPSPTCKDLYFRITEEDLESICGTTPNLVQVVNPDGQASGEPVFLTVHCPPPTPTPQPPSTPTPTPTIPIRGIGLAPPRGLATPLATPAVTPGTDIVVVGVGIKESPGPSVAVGAAACTNIRFVSATSLLATVPGGLASGTYDVQIDNNDGQAPQTIANGFSVVAPPTVTNVAIDSGAGYNNGTTSITVTGTNFCYLPKVEVGTTRCVNVEFVSPVELKAKVPSGMAAGVYDVTVVNPLNQAGTLAGGYTVLDPPAGQPVILSVSPTTGVNSTTTDIIILGTDFPASPTVRVGSTTCTNVVRVDATKVTATVPASVIGLLPGDYNVTVTDLGSKSATMTKGFTLGGSGTLNAGHWTLSRSVTLSGDLVVPDDATLTVYPGVTLTFAAGADDTSGGWDNERGEIRVYGRLNVLGEVDERATLTSDGDTDVDWLGIVFSDTEATGLIEYADISNAFYGLWFKSCRGTATADDPIPYVRDVSISMCGAGVWVNPSLGDMAPVFNRCDIRDVAVGIYAYGTEYGVSAPIFKSAELSTASTVGVQGEGESIITKWESSVSDSASAVYASSTSETAFNLIFSAIAAGSAAVNGDSTLTGRMATVSQYTSGITGGDYAKLDWAYSNVVQGDSLGTGVDWGSAAGCDIRYSVIESWWTGVSGYASAVNLGDGSPGTGYNDFLGNVASTVVNRGGGMLPAQFNWWLSTDPLVIMSWHSGDVDFADYLLEPRTYSVEGNVTDIGEQALAGARVAAYYLPREPFANRDNDRMALSDANGDYKILGLVTGDYTIEILLDSGMSTSQYVKIGSSDVTGVDLVRGIPMVTSISPATAANTGPVSTTIRGNFFESNCVVKLMKDGQDYIRGTGYTVAGDDEITGCQFDLLDAPPERWDVVVTNSDNTTGRLTAGFRITGPQPTVTGVNPASIPYIDEEGEVETVSVYGTNFFSTSRITIGVQELSDVVRVSDTELRGSVTVGLGPGWHDVTVTNGDGKTATLASSFYVVPPPGGTIIIDHLDPNGGASGDIFYIHGSGFAGIPEVIFNPGTHHATSEVLISSTEIFAKVPSDLTEGTWYDVTVNNLNPSTGEVMATGSLAHAFRYGNPQATVTSITPDYGVNTETTDVAIEGADFKAGLTASIGDTACTDLSVESETRITGTVPAGINPGYYDVVVQNTGALAGRLRYGYRVDADTDGDLVGDRWEYSYWGDLDEPGAGDWDGDGFTNLEEYRNGTNPLVNSDVDGDGMPDYWEEMHGLDKYDPSDADLDSDGDGFTNLEEFLANHRGGTNPADDTSVPETGADWDEDGMDNAYELKFGLNPKVDDGGDGGDGDPDGDGITNRDEFAAGSNPLNANSTPGNPDVLAGTIAVLRQEGGVDQNVYFYNTVRPGDRTYWAAFSRNPSALARDFWIIPQGDAVRSIAALDMGSDDVSELAVLRMDGGDDPNLYVYSAPGYGERTYSEAAARNASPLARDFWFIPAGDVVAMASVDADGDGTEEAAVLKRTGSDMNLYLYSWPEPGDFCYWDAEARNPSPLARDFWSLTAGDNIEAMASLDGDGDGVDELAVVRLENGEDYNLYLYRCPVPGDWTYWDTYARNPSALSRDFWIIPAGNDVSGICGLDADLDDRDELVVLKSTGDGDYNLYVYNAPEDGDWGYYDAGSRNPSPLGRDLWIIPGANDVEAITSVR